MQNCTTKYEDRLKKYRVAIEVLSYHNTATEDEIRRCLDGGIPDHVTDIDNYHFNPFAFDDFQKAKYIHIYLDTIKYKTTEAVLVNFIE